MATKSFEYYYRNPAIRVLDSVQKTNVTKWGFAIYRCTYTDEGAWMRLLDALGAYIRKSFANSQALDMLENFELDIREDRKALENATPEYVREQFQSWIMLNGMAESPNPTHTLRFKDNTPDETCIPFSTRYQFCVHVDSASLDSIIRALDGDEKVNSYVTLISATHGLFEPPPVKEEVLDDESPEDNNDGLEGYISELDEEPLGYTRVKFSGLMPEIYGTLRDWSDFDRVYRKPPSIWGGGAYYANDVDEYNPMV